MNKVKNSQPIAFDKYNGVDVISELDNISDQVEIGGISKNVLIELLCDLIEKVGQSDGKARIWSASELKFLSENYANLSNQEIANRLDRTVSSVNVKSHTLGLKKTMDYRSVRNGENSGRKNRIIPRKTPIKRNRINKSTEYSNGILRHVMI